MSHREHKGSNWVLTWWVRIPLLLFAHILIYKNHIISTILKCLFLQGLSKNSDKRDRPIIMALPKLSCPSFYWILSHSRDVAFK